MVNKISQNQTAVEGIEELITREDTREVSVFVGKRCMNWGEKCGCIGWKNVGVLVGKRCMNWGEKGQRLLRRYRGADGCKMEVNRKGAS